MSDDLSGVRRPNFSQRHGHEPYPPPLQVDDLDERTRTNLWNFIFAQYFNPTKPFANRKGIWTDFLGRYAHEYSDYTQGKLKEILLDIVAKFPFNMVFDLIEYLLQATTDKEVRARLKKLLNEILALNRVGYRIGAEDLVTSITDVEELRSVETAANSPSPATREHMRRAVKLFADSRQPAICEVDQRIDAGGRGCREGTGCIETECRTG